MVTRRLAVLGAGLVVGLAGGARAAEASPRERLAMLEGDWTLEGLAPGEMRRV